jgi:hypothetical protein
MPLNSFSVGHDIAVDVVDPVTGSLVAWPNATGFDAEPNTKQISSEPLNGPPLYAENPMGWKGSIEFDRIDSTVDDFFARNEALYYQGANLLSGTITQTIQETRTGAVSQYRFSGVAFKLTQAGKWKSGDKVMMKIDWVASQRVKVI